jgi:hypothetical protein
MMGDCSSCRYSEKYLTGVFPAIVCNASHGGLVIQNWSNIVGGPAHANAPFELMVMERAF